MDYPYTKTRDRLQSAVLGGRQSKSRSVPAVSAVVDVEVKKNFFFIYFLSSLLLCLISILHVTWSLTPPATRSRGSNFSNRKNRPWSKKPPKFEETETLSTSCLTAFQLYNFESVFFSTKRMPRNPLSTVSVFPECRLTREEASQWPTSSATL